MLCRICIVQIQPRMPCAIHRSCTMYGSHPATWARRYRSGTHLPCLADLYHAAGIYHTDHLSEVLTTSKYLPVNFALDTHRNSQRTKALFTVNRRNKNINNTKFVEINKLAFNFFFLPQMQLQPNFWVPAPPAFKNAPLYGATKQNTAARALKNRISKEARLANWRRK